VGLFEVLAKRRKFLPLYEQVWAFIKPHLTINPNPANEITHRLECFYYASVVYSSVYQAALAAGMSTSSAYSLARIQLRKCPFDSALTDAVDGLFVAEAESREQRFAEQLQATIGRIAAAAVGSPGAPSVDPASELEGLARAFADYDFAAEGIYPPRGE